ncbi:Cation-independent mannose-6-phosphate receptor [Halotydeus destructor]|nr:Cation-independent mannose-6-phosphate receptor [Halotydeus destructor]
MSSSAMMSLYLICSLITLSALTAFQPASGQDLSLSDLCNESQSDFQITKLEDSIFEYVRDVKSSDGSRLERHEYYFSFCSTLGNHSRPNIAIPDACQDKHVCFISKDGNITKQIDGYGKEDFMHSRINKILKVHFTGAKCDVMEKRIFIDFTCHVHAGLGKPIFVSSSETSCATYFNWPSVVACGKETTKQLTKCYVHDDNGDLIDLSPLTKQNGEAHHVEVAPDPSGIPTEMLLNVCAEADVACSSPGTAVCRKRKNEKLTTALGDVRHSELIWNTEQQEVILKYNGTRTRDCPDVLTVVRFKCPSKKRNLFGMDSRRPFLKPDDPDFIIDLSPLKKVGDYYSVKNVTVLNGLSNSSYDFSLNVCGGIGKELVDCGSDWSSSTVCLKSTDGSVTQVIGSKLDSKLTYSDGKIILTYHSRNGNCSESAHMNPITSIEFICDKKAGHGEPEFVDYDECKYQFEWRTELACPPDHYLAPACNVELDDGTVYDLSPLKKTQLELPWQATTSEYLPWSRHAIPNSESVYMNICGSLGKRSKCVGLAEGVGICKYDEAKNSSISLGRFSEPPTYDAGNDRLSLTFRDVVSNRSIVSKIHFHCKPGRFDTLPVLMEKVDTGKPNYTSSYEFEWHTGAACPLTTFTGENCIVYDKNLGLNIDLNPLRDETHGYHLVTKGKYKYFLNVCGSVKNSPCKADDVGACQVDKVTNRQYLTGKYNSTITYWNGIISLTYGDGSSYNDEKKTPRKTNIAFICDPSQVGEPKLEGEYNQTYFFKWYTKYACPNVAGHVPSVCKVDTLDRVSPFSLGVATEPPQHLFDDGISIIYRGGDRCPNDTSISSSSRLRFQCDPGAGIGMPEMIEYVEHECSYTFEWRTSVVCEPTGPVQLQISNCTFTDPRTRLSANLQHLRKAPSSPYEVPFTDSKTKNSITLNVCDYSSAHTDPNCKYSAVCMQKSDKLDGTPKYLSYGNLGSGEFSFDNNELKLVYPDGSDCSESDEPKNHSTEIRFKCNPEEESGKPKLVDVLNCKALFEWETSEVCKLKPSHPCTLLTDQHFYDLRLLSSGTHQWEAKDAISNETYYLNVCHSVSREVKCPEKNSAACLCKGANCRGLGEASSAELTEKSNGSLLLKYGRGSTDGCIRGSSSTEIRFECGRSLGRPKFIKADNCVFYFEWKTYAACPKDRDLPEPLKLVRKGQFEVYLVDERLMGAFNVTSLYEQEFDVVGINEHTGDKYEYIINLGSYVNYEAHHCDNASVCQTKENSTFHRDIGSFDTEQFFLRGSELHVVLYSKDPSQRCGKNSNKKVNTIIVLQCSSSAGVGQPKFDYESNDCDYRFIWETSAICTFIPEPVPSSTESAPTPGSRSDTGATKDESESSSSLSLVSIIFILVIASLIAGFIVLGADRRRQLLSRVLSPSMSSLVPLKDMTDDQENF